MSQRPENFFHQVLAMREAQREVRRNPLSVFWRKQRKVLEQAVDQRLHELESLRETYAARTRRRGEPWQE